MLSNRFRVEMGLGSLSAILNHDQSATIKLSGIGWHRDRVLVETNKFGFRIRR